VIELEEQHLRDLFDAYEDYARRVPKLIGLRRGTPKRSDPFEFKTYLANREYQALLGFLLGLGFLVAKWLW
jgi:hypothetical protein